MCSANSALCCLPRAGVLLKCICEGKTWQAKVHHINVLFWIKFSFNLIKNGPLFKGLDLRMLSTWSCIGLQIHRPKPQQIFSMSVLWLKGLLFSFFFLICFTVVKVMITTLGCHSHVSHTGISLYVGSACLRIDLPFISKKSNYALGHNLVTVGVNVTTTLLLLEVNIRWQESLVVQIHTSHLYE